MRFLVRVGVGAALWKLYHRLKFHFQINGCNHDLTHFHNSMWLENPKFGLSDYFKASVFKCFTRVGKMKIGFFIIFIELRLDPYPYPFTRTIQ